jgi:hypothetical protein
MMKSDEVMLYEVVVGAWTCVVERLKISPFASFLAWVQGSGERHVFPFAWFSFLVCGR